jgi:hypothetical protein
MRFRWIYAAALLAFLLPPSRSAAQEKDIVGRVEKVRIYPGDLVLRAKIDTGARNSSLHAPSVTRFEKDGESWVRFSVKDHRGEEATIERKIVRQARIKQKGEDSEKRPVITLGVCLGKQYREVEVNLVDRANFNYQMLIGRSFMAGHFVVDPELKYTVGPNCVGAPMP